MKSSKSTIPDQWQVQVLCHVLQKASVWFVTRPELRSEIEAMHMHYAASVEEALASANISEKESLSVPAGTFHNFESGIGNVAKPNLQLFAGKAMGIIRNIDVLLGNAVSTEDRLARELALGALDEAILSADPVRVIKEKVRLEGHQLLVNNARYDLSKFKRIFVVGAGKGCVRMAVGVQEILRDRITEGYLNVLRGSVPKTQTYHRIKLNEASHPLPDEAGVAGAQKMKELIRDAGESDLVLCLISGGGSALMPLPREGVSLDEKVRITKALLNAGATINELNSVRKHLSDIKGGWLAKAAGGAHVVTLIISDVVGDSLDVIASGPTAPDSTTFNDAISVLRKYRLWEEASEGIRRILQTVMLERFLKRLSPATQHSRK